MASVEREASRDRDHAGRHQHSFSESGRSSVPMWDSSDPDRAPPPLPIPPGANSPTTKANTSAGIAAAAKQIVERARESAPLSSYTSNNPTPQGSPERSLIKGAHHKRMQSLQTGSVKDLRSYLDNNRSPDRSPERPSSRSGPGFTRQESREEISLSAERSSTPTPGPRDLTKDTPTLRPSTRQPPRSILSENTPPSSTMLALQTMQVPEHTLHDITNGPSTPSPIRVSTQYDFSSQLLHLTSIATSLQKEMASLSRRSKDNATDLISLKEATNQRDEDIRKSLRELANVVGSTPNLLSPPPLAGGINRNMSSYGFLDSKAFNSPPSATKTWSIPRSSSAHGFLEEGRIGSPSPYSVEGAASVAMLEKIIREMVTKEGQERLLSTLSELLEKSQKENTVAAKKVEELSEFIKQNQKPQSQALVAMPKDGGPPRLELNFESPSQLTKITREGATEEHTQPAGNDEVLNILKRIKESVAHAGGSTNEVKGLVRDLRGEVLGMGRELGRKLDQVSQAQLDNSLDKSIGDGHGQQHAEEVQRIIEEGMVELKEHLSELLRQRVQHDDNDTFKQVAVARSVPSGEEIFAVVRHALAEHGNSTAKRDMSDTDETSGLDRETVIEAVKEGLVDFQPNIELQQFGLEREEVLNVIKKGLADGMEEYRSSRSEAEPVIATIDKAEIFEVMEEALKDFQPSLPAVALEQIKAELLAEFQQAFSEHQPAVSAASMNDEATRLAVIEAVKEGLASHGPNAPREIEISRDDLFDAVKASLDGSAIPFGGFGEQVLEQMRELIDNMRTEFKQYSAASGRDTEQVLDAVKDGLESLRAEIETYVDRAQDVTGKDEILDNVRGGLEQLRGDVQGYVAQGPVHDGGKGEMLEYIKAEFEHLHATVGDRNRELDAESQAPHTAEILLAMKAGMDGLKAQLEEKDRELEIDFPTDEIHEAMKEEFEQLKVAVLAAHAADKGELIETIQDSMGVLHARFGGTEASTLSAGATEEVINDMHKEFDTLKESIHAIIADTQKEAVVDGMRQAVEDLRIQLSADNSDASAEALAAIREELEKFKEAMTGSVVIAGAAGTTMSGHHEALDGIQTSLNELKETSTARSVPEAGVPTELLEAMRGEFENLRSSIATSVVHGGSNEEVLDALRLGLDDLRSHLEKKLDSPERSQAQQNEMLDVIGEGLETLRTDVVKTLDKPLDMTVNYEILDTLKDGLTGLRADLDALKSGDKRPVTPKGGEIVLADPSALAGERALADDFAANVELPPPPKYLKPADLEKMEVLLVQLQIKVEAMDATIQELPMSQPVDAAAMKVDLLALELMIKNVQDSVGSLAAREPVDAPEGAARKEDTDAIETLLRNTKARLDEMVSPEVVSAVTKEQLDAVEAVVRITNEAIEGLADKLENSVAAKADVAVIEVLAQDVKAALEDLKETVPPSKPDEEREKLMTKADFDILGVLCTEIKTRVDEINLPDAAAMPTKSDIEQLHGLISDFRESHDRMKDSYETDIAVTAKAFDDRKAEYEITVDQIASVKDALAEIKDELLVKLGDSDTGINALGETMKGLEEKTGSHEPVIAEIKELMEALTREFERAHSSLEAIKVDQQQSTETTFEKQAEHKDAMVIEIRERLDSVFDGLMSKYDDAQLAAQEKAKVMEEKAAAQAELLESTRVMADDLRLSIDTLGTALTTFTSTFPDSMEKLTEDSKMVFTRVDDTYNKLDETQEGLKYEHHLTRDEVAKAVAAVAGVQSDILEHNPRFLMTLKEVQALIGQQYEHSRKASEAAEQNHQAVRDLREQLKTGFEDSKMRHETQTEQLKTALPALLPAPPGPAPAIERYDDTGLHQKLDKLMGHAEQAADPSVQLERLDQIHEKVMATAAEVSAFVAAQAKQLTEDHENKEKEAEELALLLERRMVQKDEIEDDITVLNDEKESLRQAVEALKAEKETLSAQKARLAADVSSLQTALHIRREELHEMDRKAELIERRMLEGVMNQSRMLLLSKTAKSPAKRKQQGRDLRVPSNASATSAQTITSTVPSLRANHELAMKARPNLQRLGPAPNTAERRIMSLNQINHNVPHGIHPASSLLSNTSASLNRSNSVKTQPMRNGSWGGKRNLSLSGHNKENEALSEESEDELSRPVSQGEDSEAGTERRTSFVSATESGLTRDDGSYTDGITPSTDAGHRASYGTSDLSYGTGSYLTGSDVDRRISLDSSANGVLGVHQSAVEGDESQGEDQEAATAERDFAVPLQIEAPPAAMVRSEEKRMYAPPSDSGLGTELPTAALSVSAADAEYFRR
ncbi:hypothetical protein BAUCODRAFT_34279 [Baudoinia panamericana UAMH 10762]|uniref:Uncharacterized protein n=1 Tax=Baudoinia panamericana (strain UAMH 10762) TaxID=717646 RepID=M2MVC7_BAUPA|nr:uncharacterized protein BAUCODRAFT_34279 [Baudoinia panamericana UAMH 10762]EMC95528.1 hypothetical protein BAUCODRAFT_34279 [Baudoinia panamericana UAMH 10762]